MAREANDILNKYITRGVKGAFLHAFGIDLAPIVEVLPSELPVLAVHAEQPDRFFRLADRVIAHAEFQTTSEAGDLRRFYRYQFAAAEEHDTEVYTIVFYGPGISRAPHTLRHGSAIFPDGNMENRICHSPYTMQQVFRGQWDGEAVLQELRDGVASGAALSEELLTRIKLAPLMRHQRPLEDVVREVAELTSGLPKAVREETMGTMLGLGYNYLDRALIDQLLKEPSVANA